MISKRSLHLLIVAIAMVAVAGGITGLVAAKERRVLLLEVDGIINPISEGYVARGVKWAEQEHAELIIIRLDTPGGLLDSTRKIVEHLLNTEVHSVVYVSPRGARAASAGTFITAAATFAIMAPGTNIGAASPVGNAGKDMDKTMASKVTEDAAALMRGIASERGRNAEMLEKTVREAIAFDAEQAVELNVVDFIAQDVPDLLRQLHGRSASTPARGGAINTVDIEVHVLRMSLVERLLMFLADPNVSFLLLSLGGLGIMVELHSPGLIAPGVTGAILLVLAFVAFGSLPVNWAGAALILLAALLLFLEIQVVGFGFLGAGALVSFILGGLLLFFRSGAPSPTMTSMGVSLWVLIPTAAILLGGGGLVMSTMARSRQAVPDPIASHLVGATGYVTSHLQPRGTVQMSGELWSAITKGDRVILVGEEVKVVGVDGVVLTVIGVDEGRSFGESTVPGNPQHG